MSEIQKRIDEVCLHGSGHEGCCCELEHIEPDQFVDELQQTIQSLHQEVDGLKIQLANCHESLTKYIAGECACPKASNRNAESEHFPGCPMIAKQKNERLRECLQEIITEKELHGQVVDGTMKARRLLSTEGGE